MTEYLLKVVEDGIHDVHMMTDWAEETDNDSHSEWLMERAKKRMEQLEEDWHDVRDEVESCLHTLNSKLDHT